MQPEILKADAKTRQRYVILMVFVVMIGVALVYLSKEYWSWLETELQTKPTPERLDEILVEFRLMFGIVYGVVWLGVANMTYQAIRILWAGQFPLPNAKVIRDTPIVRGRAARTRAFILIGLAAVLGVLLIVLAVMGVRLFNLTDIRA